MIHVNSAIFSPRFSDRWNITSAQWASARAGIASLVYPSGVVATGVDSSIPNFATYPLPLGCSHMTQYAIANPGGRVCTEPQYQYLCYPTASAVGKTFVWLCGHLAPNQYIQTDGSSPIVQMLALGWHVLIIPIPTLDWTAVAPGPQHITINGILTSVFEHAYQPLDHDGGPNANRMFTDQAIRATTQAIADVSPSKLILAGHSGGGNTSAMVAALDSRFVAYYCFEGGLSYALGAGLGSVTDYEQAITANTIYGASTPTAQDVWGMFRIGAAVKGRRNGIASAISDEYFPITNQPLWREQTECMSDMLRSAGATVTAFTEASMHTMTAARVSWMLADIAANGF